MSKPVPDRVAFNLSPAMKTEVERILGVTDLGSSPEVFRRAFSLLRIHVNAALAGEKITLIESDGSKSRLTLPFTVAQPKDQ